LTAPTLEAPAPAARPRCAKIARQLGETVHGSAPPNCVAWLAVEHPGPWPAYGLPDDVPAEVAELLAGLPAHRIRTQLIRRPAARRATPPHRVFVAHSGLGTSDPWIRTAELADLRELLTLDPAAVARGERPAAFAEHREPVVLVCTHGKREVCCAEFGRPTVRALHREFGAPVWETTHVGGDRYAANVVTLPWAAYHGLVTEDIAGRIGATVLRGAVDLAHYRGRAGLPRPVQAAEHYVRHRTGVVAADAVTALGHEDLGDGRARVELAVGARRFRVTVGTVTSGCPRLTSCSEGSVADPHEYVLEELAEY
jgi:hypothetical protein